MFKSNQDPVEKLSAKCIIFMFNFNSKSSKYLSFNSVNIINVYSCKYRPFKVYSIF